MSESTPATETIGALLCAGGAVLRAAGIDDPRREARLLLAHALGMDAAGLLRDRHRPVLASRFRALLTRRAAREPLALITGRQGFWTLDFAVSPATLIPRADSETLVEAVLAALPDRDRVRRVLDLGTGTGCLLLAALSEFPQAIGVGVDAAPDAAALARGNARANRLDARAVFLAGNWATPLVGGFDLVLCNPPYIPAADLAGLMPEVVGYEPRWALDGGADGLDAYRAVLADLPRLLAPDGVGVIELGMGQHDAVAALARRSGCDRVTCRPDLVGIPRALVLRRAG